MTIEYPFWIWLKIFHICEFKSIREIIDWSHTNQISSLLNFPFKCLSRLSSSWFSFCHSYLTAETQVEPVWLLPWLLFEDWLMLRSSSCSPVGERSFATWDCFLFWPESPSLSCLIESIECYFFVIMILLWVVNGEINEMVECWFYCHLYFNI